MRSLCTFYIATLTKVAKLKLCESEDAFMSNRKRLMLPTEIVTAVEDCGFLKAFPAGGDAHRRLFITVLSFIMIMSVYGRFFKLAHLYTAIAPVLLSSLRRAEPECRAGALSRVIVPCALRAQSS